MRKKINKATNVDIIVKNTDTQNKKSTISRKQLLTGFLIIISLLFGLGILSASIWKAAMGRVNQKNVVLISEKSSSNEAEMIDTVDYFLVHPGVLPGNPLYLLKMGRDRISFWLTFGQLAQAQKLLLYADKRIASAGILLSNGHIESAIGIAFKAEEYAYRAVDLLPKNSDGSTSSLKDKMVKSNLKHAEILQEIGFQLGGQIPDNFRSALDYNQRANKLLVGN